MEAVTVDYRGYTITATWSGSQAGAPLQSRNTGWGASWVGPNGETGQTNLDCLVSAEAAIDCAKSAIDEAMAERREV